MMVATVKAQIVTSPRNDCPHSGVRPLAGRRGVNEGRGTELSPEAVHQEHTGIQRITQVPVRTVGDQFAAVERRIVPITGWRTPSPGDKRGHGG
jgi:hypothetical protein